MVLTKDTRDSMIFGLVAEAARQYVSHYHLLKYHLYDFLYDLLRNYCCNSITKRYKEVFRYSNIFCNII